MSRERTAICRSILENPADDAPRLVYADWLDEYGEPARAEFIRLQIESARQGDLGISFNKAVECSDPSSRLLALHGVRWLGEIFDLFGGRDWIWHRGFITEFAGAWIGWRAVEKTLIWTPGTEECPDQCRAGLIAIFDDSHRSVIGFRQCNQCDGSGRVPREIPESAHPIARVYLSDLFIASERPTFLENGTHYVSEQWPGLQFELSEQAIQTRNSWLFDPW